MKFFQGKDREIKDKVQPAPLKYIAVRKQDPTHVYCGKCNTDRNIKVMPWLERDHNGEPTIHIIRCTACGWETRRTSLGPQFTKEA